MSYFVDAQVACGSDLPIVNITGSATVRLRLYECLVGFSGSPADVATLLRICRTTDAGTGGTSLTTVLLDPIGKAADGAAKKGTYGAAPTDVAQGLRIPINQRATQRWIAREGKEIVSAAAANNGLMLNCDASTGTPNVDATLSWFE